MAWTEGTFVGFDLETTSADVETTRIVTATVVRVTPGEPVAPVNWLANPGIEIPAEATAIHGIATEHAREHGWPALNVINAVAFELCQAWRNGIPVVAYNASFDLTVLDREVRRHDCGDFTVAGPVLDPYVIDRGVDRYRKGSRKLTAVCEHYGVTLDNAHSSDADALAAVEVMRRIAEKYPEEIGTRSLRDLWTAQCQWHREHAVSFEQYLRRQKAKDGATPDEVAAVHIDRDWPIRPYLEEVSV